MLGRALELRPPLIIALEANRGRAARHMPDSRGIECPRDPSRSRGLADDAVERDQARAETSRLLDVANAQQGVLHNVPSGLRRVASSPDIDGAVEPSPFPPVGILPCQVKRDLVAPSTPGVMMNDASRNVVVVFLHGHVVDSVAANSVDGYYF